MKIIRTVASGTPKKYSTGISLTEISLAEVAPVLVQVTTRAKRRRAQGKTEAQSSGDFASKTRQAQNALLIALHDSVEAGNAGGRRQELEAATEAVQHDPVQQAREFYDTELRSQMEEHYNEQYIAIHPESRSYSVQPGYGKAFRTLRMQQPLGPIIVHNIGFANSSLKARLRGEQP